jgi:hypothetical protein
VVQLCTAVHSRRCVSTGDFGGVNRGFAARRPVGTFWYFSKSNSKSGTVHAGVDAVEQARTCAGVHRRPCCRSLKAGLELKNSREVQNLSHNFLFYQCVLYFRIQPAFFIGFKLLQHGRRWTGAYARACLLDSVNTCMYRTRFAITFWKILKSTDGATRAKTPPKSPVLIYVHLRLLTVLSLVRPILYNTKFSTRGQYRVPPAPLRPCAYNWPLYVHTHAYPVQCATHPTCRRSERLQTF